jgi:hypothetical protein
VHTLVSGWTTPKGGLSVRCCTFHVGLMALEDLKEDEYLSLGILPASAFALELQSV